MATCTMFESSDKFYLIDVDAVVSTSAIEIREPSGFGETKLSLERVEGDRGGANFEFSEAESSFGFDLWCGLDDIRTIIAENGADSNIIFEYYHYDTDSEEYVLQFSGYLIPSSMDEADDEATFRVKRTDYGDKFRTRFESPQPVDGVIDLDGNTVNAFNEITIPLHSQTIYQNIQYTTPSGDIDLPQTDIVGYNITSNLFNISNVISDNTTSLDVKTYYNEVIFTDDVDGLDPFVNYDDAREHLRDEDKYIIKATENGTYNIKYNYNVDIDVTKPYQDGSGGVMVGGMETVSYLFVYGDDGLLKTNDTISDGAIHYYFDDQQVSDDSESYNLNIEYENTFDFDEGDRLFITTYMYAKCSPASEGAYIYYTTSNAIGSLFVESYSYTDYNEARGGMIYDTLNTLIKNAVGNHFEEFELTLTGYTGTFSVGETITNNTTNATATVYTYTDGVLYLVDVVGEFNTGDSIEGDNSSATGTVSYLDAGNVIDSTILEKIEEGATEDGCASLNFVTNGITIRGYKADDYDATIYYKIGDFVTYNDLNYKYINEDASYGNLPTDTDYWEETGYRKITTSIDKIIRFLQHRYGVGFALVKAEGTGYGTYTNNKVTRVLIEEKGYFYQDKLIMTLAGVENPISKKLNKGLIYNELDYGYEIYSEAKIEATLLGFCTNRTNVTPIQKEKKKLSMLTEVCTDGQEIERMRRINRSETADQSDDKDEETFIIKCIRVDADTPFNPDPDGDGKYKSYTFIDGGDDDSIIVLNGFIAKNFIYESSTDEGFERFVYNDGTETAISIFSFTYDYENGDTYLNVGSNTLVDGTYYNPFYFRGLTTSNLVTLFLPERIESVTDVTEVVDYYSEYNMDHAPSNFLINNFNWFGGGFISKDDSKNVLFTSGKNNYLFSKSYRTTDCFPTTESITENQNFELTSLRSWNPELFNEYQYEVDCNLTYSEFNTLRYSMLNENEDDTNYGYVEFQDNQDNTVQAFPIKITYNPLKGTTKVIAWGKA